MKFSRIKKLNLFKLIGNIMIIYIYIIIFNVYKTVCYKD